ncbi:MAG: 3-dehydroquinate synthase [Bacteroidetes bacterium HGW-Bacteroidetes-4]|jgi:3-dehydroquinate synthase|nr:MAG: 3-dehydroquinate synthase [Bacteroidetes bacterium HGW-Bacteroidetes-4]
MKKLIINGELSNSELLIGESFQNFTQYLPKKQPIIVLTDDKIHALYGSYFNDYQTIVIGQTEKVKTLSTVEAVINQLTEFEADRSTFLLVVGGGIVCDIGGFVASIYMRGIEFGFISTTLLSQVDASVGGKNGVNFSGYKNIIGTFNQPKFVICDPQMLKTLKHDELINGFAEIVKHTLIADKNMFHWLSQHFEKALSLDFDTIEKLVFNSVSIKASIVNNDEKEQGERRKLNLGHTYGHAIEKVFQLSHGNAVSIGLVVAARLSMEKGFLSSGDFQQIIQLLKNLKLPVDIPDNQEKVLQALTMDKKREGKLVHFILIDEIGQARIEPIELEVLQKMLI